MKDPITRQQFRKTEKIKNLSQVFLCDTWNTSSQRKPMANNIMPEEIIFYLENLTFNINKAECLLDAVETPLSLLHCDSLYLESSRMF